MSTFIHGIASSEAIDTSGERISIEGLDISSLETSGVLTWEHDEGKLPDGQKLQIKLPSNVVGKILKAKKIFSEQDCEDDHQRYFWEKAKCPYVYVMGQLLDGYTSSADQVAGMFKYDADHRSTSKGNLLWFSVEGGKLPGKQGLTILKSIARKVTICVHPCNKQAVAEMVENPKAESKSDLESFFKSEYGIEINLFKSEPIALHTPTSLESMQKNASVLGVKPVSNVIPLKKSGMSSTTHGGLMGKTKSGKEIYTNAKIHEYKGFSASDHQEAAMMHHNASQRSSNGEHFTGKMKLHLQAAKTAENKGNRLAVGVAAKAAKTGLGMTKSLDAGSMNAAPGSLVGGAALQRESIVGPPTPKKKKQGISTTQIISTNMSSGLGLAKSEWLERSEQEYQNWPKKEVFLEFMKNERPDLVPSEIEALGKTLALADSIKMEEKLSKLMKK